MSHADAITAVPPGFVATATSADAPVAALHDAERSIYGVQFHPEVVHTERGRDLLERFLYDVCHCLPSWTHTSIIETQVQAVRDAVGSVAGAVRPVGRGRLGGGRGPGPQGHRRPAHLCLRRHRPDAGQRERAGGRDLPAAVPGRAGPREGGRPVLRGAGRGHRSRGQAQDHRRAVHPHLRRGRPRPGHRAVRSRRRRPGRVRPAPEPSGGRRASWCRGPSTPTSSSRARTAPPSSSPTTTSAASPTTWPSIWSSPSACCSRTRSGRWVRSWGCPTTSCGASPSPGRAWPCASWAR